MYEPPCSPGSTRNLREGGSHMVLTSVFFLPFSVLLFLHLAVDIRLKLGTVSASRRIFDSFCQLVPRSLSYFVFLLSSAAVFFYFFLSCLCRNRAIPYTVDLRFLFGLDFPVLAFVDCGREVISEK